MSGVGPRTANVYNAAAPANYVAGVGRGAMGFTTRSDIGPARPVPAPAVLPPMNLDAQFGPAPVGYVAGRGRGMGDLAKGQAELSATQLQQEQDRGDYSESNYDEFSGYGERLFSAGTPYEKDDQEADYIYEYVDDMMDSRRKRSREQQMLLQQKRAKYERPRIADQFADLKRELSSVSASEWDAIPEVGDHSLKLKQSKKKETFTPLPDFLLESASKNGMAASSIDPRLAGGMNSVLPGFQSALPGGQSAISGLAEARGSALTMKLDKMSDSVTGQTVVDPKGYLTSLNSLKITSEAEIGDIKKARILLQSVTTTNPKHGPGWIAAARVEEFGSKLPAARKIILRGCESCPESEDVWLEAARLHPNDVAKSILANAVQHLPSSVKIWIQAAELEQLETRKKAVLRRALEFIPNSVKLWKAAIELENVTDARIMLARAVECVPHSVEMWLALAKLETHENARRVLNQAREAIPTERATWITAAKLEEAHGNSHLVNRIIEKMVISLAQYQVIIDRDTWIGEAEDCERSEAFLTCASIIKNTIDLGVELEDRRKTWMDDAETCLSRDPPAVHTARAILNHALELFPTKKLLWQQAAMLEKLHGTAESLEDRLKEGVKHCPQAEVLWLMAAKEKWMAGNVPEARAVLLEAFNANPQSEQIWLAAVKLEWENDEYVRARMLLERARERAPSERVWLKSAVLEREVGELEAALKMLDQAIKTYPAFDKYYMIAGQICSQDQVEKQPAVNFMQLMQRARGYYSQGLKACPASIPLWRLLIQLEEKVKGVLKARPTSELSRMKLPKCPELWLEGIRLERRAGNEKLADALLVKGKKECPKSGLLWAEDLLTCGKHQQKAKAADALKACIDDPLVLLAVARLFERSQRPAKARRRFERTLAIEPKLGDSWIYYYAFEFVQAHRRKLLAGGIWAKLTSHSKEGNEQKTTTGNQLAKQKEGKTLANTSTKNSSTNPGLGGEGNTMKSYLGEDVGALDGVEGEDDEEVEDTSDTVKIKEEAEDYVPPMGSASAPLDSEFTAVNMEQEEEGMAEHTQHLQDWTRSTPVLEGIINRCVDAHPNRGEVWCGVSKEVKLRRADVATVLLIAAGRVLGLPLLPIDK